MIPFFENLTANIEYDYIFVPSVGLTASMFGLGATLSNFLGQQVVEQYGHVASLTGSLILSIIPILIFGMFMPETLGDRGHSSLSSSSVAEIDPKREKGNEMNYVEMI